MCVIVSACVDALIKCADEVDTCSIDKESIAGWVSPTGLARSIWAAEEAEERLQLSGSGCLFAALLLDVLTVLASNQWSPTFVAASDARRWASNLQACIGRLIGRSVGLAVYAVQRYSLW